MLYKELARYYESLEKTSSKLEKASILAEALSNTSSELLPKVMLLYQGRVYPPYTQLELGLASQLMIKAISKASGYSSEKVEKIFKKTGDLGLTAEECMKSIKQTSLLRKKLTVNHVFDNLQKIATITGKGSQEKKLDFIIELVISSSPTEARYIARTVLGELRIGTAEGIIKDAIVKAFLVDDKSSKEEKEIATEAVEFAWSILSDFGEVAKIAKEKGVSGLKKVKIKLGRPMQVMLGLAAEKMEDVIKEFGKVVAQYKYDGMRVIIEKSKEGVLIFTRRQENVTNQFPDIVEFAKKSLTADECIVEGEALGIDAKTGYPIPFQILGQRIHRKHDIKKMADEIPVQVNLFDVVYLDGEMLIHKPLKERLKILEKIVKPIPHKFQLAKQIITDDSKKLEKFYDEAVEARQEGLMLKIPDSPYVFGRHVGTMYKIKGVMESLDLIIIGATWGEGARAKWLTSYEIACKDSDTGKFLSVGMISTGLSEKEYEQTSKMLKPLIISEEGKNIKVKPKIVLEVGYQEIQKSPHYSSGFALRFPRFIRFRHMEKPEPDTLDRVKSLYKSKGKKG